MGRAEENHPASEISLTGRILLGVGIVLYLLLPFAATPAYYDNNDLRYPWTLVAVLFTLAGTAAILRRSPGARFRIADFAALGLVGMVLFSVVACQNRHEAFLPVQLVASTGLFFVAFRRLPPALADRWRRRIAAALPWIGGLLAAYALVQYAGRYFDYPDPVEWALQSRPTCRIPIATFANMNIVCAVFGAYFVWALVRTISRGGIVGKVLAGWAALLLLAVLAVSNERGWVLSVSGGIAAAALAAVAEGRVRVTRGRIAFAALLLATAGGLVLLHPDRWKHMNLREEQRWGIWRDTLRLAKDHPFLGVGPGNFVIQFPRYQTDNVYKSLTANKSVQVEIFSQPHNGYLHLLVESGPLALLAFLATLIFTAAGALRVCGRGSEADGGGAAFLARGGLAGAAALLAAGMVYPLYASLPIWSHLWLFLALIPDPPMPPPEAPAAAAGGREKSRKRREEAVPVAPPSLRTAVAAAAAALALATALPMSVRRAQASIALHDMMMGARSVRTNKDRDAVFRWIRRAIEIDPDDWVIRYQASQVATIAGRRDEAIRLCDGTLALAPNDLATLLTRGNLRSQTGDLKGAREDFETAGRVAPKFFMSWFLLGHVAMMEGDAPAATAHFEKVAALEADYHLLHPYLGMAYVLTGQIARARASFDAARPKPPGGVAGQVSYSGETIILGIGKRDGAVTGQVYAVIRDNRKAAFLEVTKAREADSDAQIAEGWSAAAKGAPSLRPEVGDRVVLERDPRQPAKSIVEQEARVSPMVRKAMAEGRFNGIDD